MKIELPKYFKFDSFKLVGVYFLIQKGEIVYIGKTVNLFNRLLAHPCSGKYDHIRLIPCDKQKLSYYEKRWILRFAPKYNILHLSTWKSAEAGFRKYTRIYRNQAAVNGFKVVQIGSIKLIEELKVKKKQTV